MREQTPMSEIAFPWSHLKCISCFFLSLHNLNRSWGADTMRLREASRTTLRSISRLLPLFFLAVAIPVAFTVFGQSSSSQPQQPPKANAGPAQTVSVGTTVFLDGSSSSAVLAGLLMTIGQSFSHDGWLLWEFSVMARKDSVECWKCRLLKKS